MTDTTNQNWWNTPYDDLLVQAHEVAGRRIAVITFNLPERRNSMSEAMTASWARLIQDLRMDESLAAVVVTGLVAWRRGAFDTLTARRERPAA